MHPLLSFFLAAKWSSTEEIKTKTTNGSASSATTAGAPSGGAGQQKPIWSPESERKAVKDYKPVNFDGNSLKRSEIKGNQVSCSHVFLFEIFGDDFVSEPVQGDLHVIAWDGK